MSLVIRRFQKNSDASALPLELWSDHSHIPLHPHLHPRLHRAGFLSLRQRIPSEAEFQLP